MGEQEIEFYLPLQILIYSDSGQLTVQNNAKDGKFHGVYKQWHADGTLNKEVTYKNGEIISERISVGN